jgi:HrpA-like RNA helicase
MSNISLPIDAFRRQIMACDSKYIIIEAETGSGKSTQIPRWYFEAGLSVLVTEPLIETVIGTSQFVAEQMGVKLGTTVGYRTGLEHCDSSQTKVLFATDGLAMVREMSGRNHFNVLVIDELHQWNTNQSTLEAWAWKELKEGTLPFDKIVVLSATIDSKELSQKRGNAPVFKVPGRSFPITDRAAGYDIATDVSRLVEEGYDVLVFQPGKREISDLIDDLTLASINAELFPFHGELERAEKDRVYRSYSRPKVIITTPALETGRTVLPSKGRKLAVVDSGMERRIELVNGVETLVLTPISKAQSKQRRGRTGRVSEGLYIDHCPAHQRSEYPTPEILRTRLDQTVLRLAVAGFDALELPFFHDLNIETVLDAKRSLRALGAMTNSGKVTAIGRKMARLPVSVQFARMIVEAQRLGVLDDVITIASILEQGGISNNRNPVWRNLVQGEMESDLIAHLHLYEAAHNMKNAEMKQKGIHPGSFRRVKETRRKLVEALDLPKAKLTSTGSRDAILHACVSGMVDHLFKNDYGVYVNGDGTGRELARESVVSRSELLVGMPMGIQIKSRFGGTTTLHLVSMATKVDGELLTKVAPHLVLSNELKGDYRYDPSKKMVVDTESINFNGQIIDGKVVQAPKCKEATEALIRALVEGNTEHPAENLNIALLFAFAQLAQRDGRVRLFDGEQLAAHYRKMVNGATTMAEINGLDLMVNPSDFVPADLLPELSKCLIGKDEICRRGEALKRELDEVQWSLSYGELSSKVSNLIYSYSSSPMKLVSWMVEAQTVIGRVKVELDRIRAERKERLRQEELRRQAEEERLQRERQEYEVLRKEAEELKEQAVKLLDSELNEHFADDVCDGLMGIEDAFLSPLTGTLRSWMENAKAIISQAEATVVPDDSGNVPADAMAALLANFGGDVRR